MTFGDAVNSVLSKYATFDGRASRAEFWRWVVVFVLLTLITRMIDGALFLSSIREGLFARGAMQPLTYITILVLLLPNLALAVRRLHDTGRSGWWLLLMLVPFVGPLVLLYWYVQPSDDGPNPYGAGSD
jgi:uncharacterized membrane protein YhaH (DUF805 family)